MLFGDNPEAVDYPRGKCWFPVPKISPKNVIDLTKVQEYNKLSGRCGDGSRKKPTHPRKPTTS